MLRCLVAVVCALLSSCLTQRLWSDYGEVVDERAVSVVSFAVDMAGWVSGGPTTALVMGYRRRDGEVPEQLRGGLPDDGWLVLNSDEQLAELLLRGYDGLRTTHCAVRLDCPADHHPDSLRAELRVDGVVLPPALGRMLDREQVTRLGLRVGHEMPESLPELLRDSVTAVTRIDWPRVLALGGADSWDRGGGLAFVAVAVLDADGRPVIDADLLGELIAVRAPRSLRQDLTTLRNVKLLLRGRGDRDGDVHLVLRADLALLAGRLGVQRRDGETHWFHLSGWEPKASLRPPEATRLDYCWPLTDSLAMRLESTVRIRTRTNDFAGTATRVLATPFAVAGDSLAVAAVAATVGGLLYVWACGHRH